MTAQGASQVVYLPAVSGLRGSRTWRVVRQLRRNPSALLGGGWLIVVLLVALLGPTLVSASPHEQDILARLRPPVWEEGGSRVHPLGTDALGRDVLARLVQGARITLRIAALASLVAVAIGVPLGLLAGYRGGFVATLILRFVDALIAFPFMVIAITAVAVFGNSEKNLILTLGLFAWVSFARTARAETLSLKEREFITAARATGATSLRIAARHILPGLVPTMLVIWTFTFSTLILLESSLTFLGFGLAAGTPSWGAMLAEGRAHLSTDTWLALIPGIALTSLVVAVGLFGDALRDAVDPRLTR
jgi:peptide/nickel transport system permease protein